MAITRSMKKRNPWKPTHSTSTSRNTDTPCLDIVSNLPSSIIENILCRLPIREAARTSILSKEWRYHWTKIPKLDFNLRFWSNVSTHGIHLTYDEWMAKRRALLCAIHQVLLRHQGPIYDFTLFTNVDDTCVEINQIILALSRFNTVTKLRLCLNEVGLPSPVFSLHQLTDLYLGECEILHQPPFNRFSSLTTLSLSGVRISQKTLLHILSSCPLLKSFTLQLYEETIIDNVLSFVEIFKCLPSIEHFATWRWIITCFDEYDGRDLIPRMLPTSLVHLKYFYLEDMDFCNNYGLPFLAILMRSSPNLEKIKLIMYSEGYDDAIEPVTSEDYSDIWLEHLNELEVIDFNNLKHELEFVKFILAKAPVLKKVNIFLSHMVNQNEEIRMLRILLRSPRASPVEIVVQGPHSRCF